jgi:4-amino-4-deoxy-L-arabinose transferase-like glycosyltransferase
MDLRSFSRAAGGWVRRTALALTDRRGWAGWFRGVPGRTLLCLLLLAAVAVPVIFSRLGEADLRNDEAIYARIADRMHARGDWLVSHLGKFPYFMKPPLYFWLTTLTYDHFPDTGLRYRFWSALFGLGCVLLTCVVGARLWGPLVGLLAGGILLLNGDFLFNHGIREGCMDTGVTLCLLACLLCYWSASRSARPLGWWVLLGLFAGCASMFKTLTGLPLIGLFGLHLLLRESADDRQAGREAALLRKGVCVGVAAAVSLFLIGPWAAYQWWCYQDTFLDSFFWDSLVRRANEGLDQSHLHGAAFYLLSIMKSSKPFLLLVPALLFCAFGAFRGNRRAACGLTALIIGCWIGLFSLGASKLAWYVYPVYPLIAVAVAALLVSVLWRLARLLPRRLGAAAAGLGYAVVLFLVLDKSYLHWQHIRGGPPERYAPWQAYTRLSRPIEKKDVLFVLYRLPGLQDENYHWYYARKMRAAVRTWQASRLGQLLAAGRPAILVVRRNDLADVQRALKAGKPGACELIDCANKDCFVPTRYSYCVVAVGGEGLLEQCFGRLPPSCPIRHLGSGRDALALWQ